MCDYMPDIVGECVRLKWKQFSHGIYDTRLISGLSEDEIRQMSHDKVEKGCTAGKTSRVGSRLRSARLKRFSTGCRSSQSHTPSTSCPTISDPEGEQHVSLPEHSRTAH
jgi:hypothetical protein